MNILKTTIASLAIGVTVLPVLAPVAQTRPNTTRLSCNQTKDLVYSRGAVVLSTGRNTFDRFVANQSFCPSGDYVERAFVRTRDRNSCSIGYTCTGENPWERWRD